MTSRTKTLKRGKISAASTVYSFENEYRPVETKADRNRSIQESKERIREVLERATVLYDKNLQQIVQEQDQRSQMYGLSSKSTSSLDEKSESANASTSTHTKARQTSLKEKKEKQYVNQLRANIQQLIDTLRFDQRSNLLSGLTSWISDNSTAQDYDTSLGWNLDMEDSQEEDEELQNDEKLAQTNKQQQQQYENDQNQTNQADNQIDKDAQIQNLEIVVVKEIGKERDHLSDDEQDYSTVPLSTRHTQQSQFRTMADQITEDVDQQLQDMGTEINEIWTTWIGFQNYLQTLHRMQDAAIKKAEKNKQQEIDGLITKSNSLSEEKDEIQYVGKLIKSLETALVELKLRINEQENQSKLMQMQYESGINQLIQQRDKKKEENEDFGKFPSPEKFYEYENKDLEARLKQMYSRMVDKNNEIKQLYNQVNQLVDDEKFLNLADVGFTTRTLKPYDIPKIVVDFSEDEFKEFGNVFDLHRKINKQTQTIMKNKMLGKMTSIEKKVLDGENAGMGTLARKLAKEFQKRQKLEEQKKKNKLKTESIFSDQKKTGKEEDENYQDYEEQVDDNNIQIQSRLFLFPSEQDELLYMYRANYNRRNLLFKKLLLALNQRDDAQKDYDIMVADDHFSNADINQYNDDSDTNDDQDEMWSFDEAKYKTMKQSKSSKSFMSYKNIQVKDKEDNQNSNEQIEQFDQQIKKSKSPKTIESGIKQEIQKKPSIQGPNQKSLQNLSNKKDTEIPSNSKSPNIISPQKDSENNDSSAQKNKLKKSNEKSKGDTSKSIEKEINQKTKQEKKKEQDDSEERKKIKKHGGKEQQSEKQQQKEKIDSGTPNKSDIVPVLSKESNEKNKKDSNAVIKSDSQIEHKTNLQSLIQPTINKEKPNNEKEKQLKSDLSKDKKVNEQISSQVELMKPSISNEQRLAEMKKLLEQSEDVEKAIKKNIPQKQDEKQVKQTQQINTPSK
ncbi:MAG: hypothetical protein EZS28_023599, partial [Streblomastix strix]